MTTPHLAIVFLVPVTILLGYLGYLLIKDWKNK